MHNNIRNVKTYYQKPGNKKNPAPGYLISENTFDEQGNCTEYKSFTKSGRMKKHWIYKFNSNNDYIESTQLKANGRFISKFTWEYDSFSNLTDTRLYWKKPDKMSWHSKSVYDDKNNMTEIKYLTAQDKKLTDRYVYSYYPDGGKKQTLEYNRKGKIIHTWNYDCDPTGNAGINHLKDSSKICIRYETDKNGNRIKIKEENIKQGRRTRTISKFDKNDNLLEWIGYNRKGRIILHSRALYDDKNNITERTQYKKDKTEVLKKFLFHYDTAGNLTEEIAYKGASTIDHVTKFDYSGLK